MRHIGAMAAAFLVVAALGGPRTARSQGSDAALRDRVGQLVEKLDSPTAEARDGAEKALMGLGEKALPFLPEPSPTHSERDQRVGRIRDQLRQAQDHINLGASRVTLRGQDLRLSEVLRALQKQSGNLLTDQRDEAANPSLELDLEDRPFLDALQVVADKAQVGLTFLTNDGSIGLMDPPAARPSGSEAPRVVVNGPFRIVLKEISAKRSFEAGSALANVQFEIDWEPRLRPMLLAWKAEGVTIADDQGRPVSPMATEETTSVILRPSNPSAELNLNLAAPPRDARSLSTLKVKADVTVPSTLRTFPFPSLTAKEVRQVQGDVAVTLESTEVEEGRWRLNVLVDYQGKGPAFESYQQGLFNNRLWLRRADGSKFEHNGGMNQTSNDDGKMGFEYFFVDVPGKVGDYQFIYETPSKVETIPLEFEFKDVPLP